MRVLIYYCPLEYFVKLLNCCQTRVQDLLKFARATGEIINVHYFFIIYVLFCYQYSAKLILIKLKFTNLNTSSKISNVNCWTSLAACCFNDTINNTTLLNSFRIWWRYKVWKFYLKFIAKIVALAFYTI